MAAPRLYLDQNFLSGIVKGKPAFLALASALRDAVHRGALEVVESPVHRIESAPRPDLPVLELLRSLSGGRMLPGEPGREERDIERRLAAVIALEFPERARRASDRLDLRALALALPRCQLIATDAFMVDVVRRTRLDRRYGVQLFSGRRPDVARLERRLATL